MKIYLLLFCLFLSSTILKGQAEKLHPWTDAQGRTLQASFISFDGTKVTIKWDGQVVPIPLAVFRLNLRILPSNLERK